jgi:hypothetical protein
MESQCSSNMHLLYGKNAEVFSIYLLAISTSPESYLLNSFAHFLIGLLGFWCLIIRALCIF